MANRDLRGSIASLLEVTRQKVQTSMDNAGVNASGRTRDSIRVDIYDNGVRLIGGGLPNTAPIPTLEVGRVGGKVPSGFTDILEQWSRDKGLDFESDAERRTFAYFLGRKIAREGTLRNKSPKDVYSTIVTDAVPEIRRAVEDIVKEQILPIIRRANVTTGGTHF